MVMTLQFPLHGTWFAARPGTQSETRELFMRQVIGRPLLHHRKTEGETVWPIGGKSMGGRIASQVAAQSEGTNTSEISALVFLGYPIAPTREPRGKTSDFEHLPNVRGANALSPRHKKNVFGTPDELQTNHIKRLKLPAKLYVDIEGGDHSFKVAEEFSHTSGADLRARNGRDL